MPFRSVLPDRHHGRTGRTLSSTYLAPPALRPCYRLKDGDRLPDEFEGKE